VDERGHLFLQILDRGEAPVANHFAREIGNHISIRLSQKACFGVK
jgi:hypothetical protein